MTHYFKSLINKNMLNDNIKIFDINCASKFIIIIIIIIIICDKEL